jgi:iron complex transport system substrate-binding protein
MEWQENKLLSNIAPTILIDGLKDWQENIGIVAKALDRENNLQKVIDSHQEKLMEVRTQLTPLVKTHPRILNISSSLSMDYIEIKYYGEIIKLLEKIGFQTVLLKDVKREPGVRPQINLETLSQLDADIIIVQTWLDDWDGTSKYNVPLATLQEKWSQNPLLHNSRAWKEGRVYFVDYTLWGGVISGPKADSLMLEKLPKLLLSSK